MSDDNYWDGKDIHWAWGPGQSAQVANTCCGLTLSTWAGPHAQKGKGWSYEVGYSFTPEEITCPNCIKWMETNFHRCECGKIAQYKKCTTCAEEWFRDKFCANCHRMLEYCQCTK